MKFLHVGVAALVRERSLAVTSVHGSLAGCCAQSGEREIFEAQHMSLLAKVFSVVRMEFTEARGPVFSDIDLPFAGRHPTYGWPGLVVTLG